MNEAGNKVILGKWCGLRAVLGALIGVVIYMTSVGLCAPLIDDYYLTHLLTWDVLTHLQEHIFIILVGIELGTFTDPWPFVLLFFAPFLPIYGFFTGLLWKSSEKSTLSFDGTNGASPLVNDVSASFPRESVPSAVNKEQIITVHGTFAAHAASEGHSWWQIGEDGLVQALNARLSDRALVGKPFHWSGGINESERQNAAERLAKQILTSEKENRKYHLVGHSHGGNVVWQALQIASKDRPHLPNLVSWTTVGTPFLHFGPEPIDLGLVASFALLVWMFLGESSQYPHLSLIGVARLTWTLLPNLSSDGGSVLLAWVVESSILVIILILALITIRLTISLVGWIRFPYRKKSERNTYSSLTKRHLAIWSSKDEAISGLIGCLHIGLPLTPVFPLRGKGFWANLTSPIRLLMIGFYNVLVGPSLSLFAKNLVRDRMLGNNLAFSRVHEVSSAPIATEPGLSVSPEVEEWLAEFAGQHASKTLDGVREALGVFSSGSSWSYFESRVKQNASFDGLIHNSYFACPGVIEAICAHIAITGVPASSINFAGSQNRSSIGRLAMAVTVTWAIVPWLFTMIVVLCCAAYASFHFSVETHSLSYEIPAMIQMARKDVVNSHDDTKRLWMAALANGDNVAKQEAFQEASASIKYEDLAPALEVVRWLSACSGKDCGARDDLLRQLSDNFDYLSPYMSYPKKLQIIADSLSSLESVPEFRVWHTTTKSTYPFTRPDTSVFSQRTLGVHGSSAEEDAQVSYITPLYSPQTSATEFSKWDSKISPLSRLRNKLWLIDALHCDRDEAAFNFGETRDLVLSLSSKIRARSLWLNSSDNCTSREKFEQVVLLAARSDWNLLPSSAKAADLAAKMSWDCARVQEFGDNRSMAQMGVRFAAEAEGQLLQDLKENRVQKAFEEASAVVRALRIYSAKDVTPTMKALLAKVNWEYPPMMELADVAKVSVGSPVRQEIAISILNRTATMNAIPSERDQPMFHLLSAFDQDELDRIGYRVLSAHLPSGRQRTFKALLGLPVFVGRAEGARDEEMPIGSFDGKHCDGNTRNRCVAAWAEYDVEQFLNQHVGDALASELNSWLAIQFAEDNRLRHAMRYAMRATDPDDRVRAFTAILIVYESDKKLMDETRIDSILDIGDDVLNNAIAQWNILKEKMPPD